VTKEVTAGPKEKMLAIAKDILAVRQQLFLSKNLWLYIKGTTVTNRTFRDRTLKLLSSTAHSQRQRNILHGLAQKQMLKSSCT
jgi:hypothetical protein